MKIGYLINQYPKVSHSFIRREIRELELQQVSIVRYALRGWDADLVDADDLEERTRTIYLLKAKLRAFAGALAWQVARAPVRSLRTLATAVRCGVRSDRPIFYAAIYFVESCLLARWSAKARLDHLHVHFGTNATHVAMLCRMLGGPTYSFTVHGPDEFDAPLAQHLAEKIRRSAFTVAISSFGRSQLLRWAAPGDWDKVVVIHCGIDEAFRDADVDDGFEDDRIVCVGRLSGQKGQLLLVAAIDRLRAEGRKVRLVLAGDGEMRGVLEAAIRDAALADQIRITGWLSSAQVRDEIRAARALVLSSFAEGLPVVCMEAMALGRPVLAPYIAGIPELIRPGVEGWLYPASDTNAMTEAITRILRDSREQIEQMGARARVRVLERHDMRVEAAKLKSAFELAIASNPASRGHRTPG